MMRGVMPWKAMMRIGTSAMGGRAKSATLMPRASRAETGHSVKAIAAAIAIRLPIANPANAATSVART